MRRPSLKKRWLVAGVTGGTGILLSVGVIWMFGTYDPTEKVYSADGQYSYYTAKYNYNRIPFVNWVIDKNSKAWLYDEVEHKRLASGSVGNVEWNDKFGFEDFANTTFFFKNRQYELPRPIDEMAIRKKEQQARWEAERTEAIRQFRQQQAESPISAAEAAWLEPTIGTWLDFYGIDLAGARKAGERTGVCFNCPSDPAKDPYYGEFSPEDDSPSLVQVSYSPDRQRYVDMLIDVEMRGGVPHDTGMYDVDQSVLLVDRRKKTKNQLVFNGSSERVEDIFWDGNDVFVMVGFSRHSVVLFRVDVYDIPGRTHKTYEVLHEGDSEKLGDLFSGYPNEVYLRSRGIVPYKYNE